MSYRVGVPVPVPVPVTCVVLDIGGVLEMTPEIGWLQRWERDVRLAPGSTLDRLADGFEAGSLGGISEPEVQALRARWRTGILSNSFVGASEREQERYGL